MKLDVQIHMYEYKHNINMALHLLNLSLQCNSRIALIVQNGHKNELKKK